MAAINFPALPAVGDLFSVAGTGVTYRWNGLVWLVQAGPGGGTGDFCAIHNTTWSLTASPAIMIPNTVYSGNAVASYSISTGRYIPPAGRYRLSVSGSPANSGGTSGSSNFQIRKNGTIINQQNATTPASTAEIVSVEVIADANGSDYFEVWGYTGASTGTVSFLTFQAFPLTGMQGPQGMVGSIGTRIHGVFGAGGLPTGPWTALGSSVITNDTGVNPVGNNWTPPAGRWLVGANAQITGPNANDCGLGLGINGSISNSQGITYSPTAGAHISFCIQDVVDFDGLTSMCWMGISGGAGGSVAAQSWWSATRVR